MNLTPEQEKEAYQHCIKVPANTIKLRKLLECHEAHIGHLISYEQLKTMFDISQK